MILQYWSIKYKKNIKKMKYCMLHKWFNDINQDINWLEANKNLYIKLLQSMCINYLNIKRWW